MDQPWRLWISDCSLSFKNEIVGIHFTRTKTTHILRGNYSSPQYFSFHQGKSLSAWFAITFRMCKAFQTVSTLQTCQVLIISKHISYLQRHKRQQLWPQYANFVFDLDIFGLNWVQNGNILDTTVFTGTKGHFFRIKSSPGGCIRT